MKIYSIIVTYNAMPWIDKCLSSVFASTLSIIPIVVDNNSQDETVDYIRKHFPKTVIFEQKHNLGFGQANNVGIEYSLVNNVDFILLLNQDAWIDKDMIEKLLLHNDGKSLLSPIHLNEKGEALDFNFKSNTLLNNKKSLLFDDLILKKVREKYPASYVNAACWLLPIQLVKEIGGFNPLFFHYGEDDNYLQRLKYHNKNIFVVTNTFAYHDRLEFGNKDVYRKDIFYRILLDIKLNINNSRKERITANLKCFFMKTSSSIITQKSLLPLYAFIKARIKLLIQSTQIKESKDKETRLGTTWLKV